MTGWNALVGAMLFGAMLFAVAAAAPAPDLAPGSGVGKPARAIKLDKTLKEISGLATAGPNSVFAHNDEHAIIHEIDVRTGAVIRSFALGKPTVAGDFEAVAVRGDMIYLATSGGLLYEARIKKHRERTSYNVFDTGLGGVCEVEGLAFDSEANAFLLLCKRAALDPERKRLIIYRWTFTDRLAKPRPWLDLSWSDLLPAHARSHEVRASELARDPKSGNLFIVDSNAAAIIEITPQGKAAGYRALAKESHPQAEGLALMSDGSIVVGDEGRGKAGRLTVYGPPK